MTRAHSGLAAQATPTENGGCRMTSIPEKELQINLDSILSRAQTERIVISRRGKPCAVLVGIEDYNSEELRLASSVDFWRIIRQRRASGTSFPLTEVEVSLGIMPGKSTGKRARAKKPRRHSSSP
jgi:prevent-host-death family protein